MNDPFEEIDRSRNDDHADLMNKGSPRKILFERVFAWSYVPKNTEGLLALSVLGTIFAIGVGLVEFIDRLLIGHDLTVLKFVVGIVGIAFIQRFVMRHS